VAAVAAVTALRVATLSLAQQTLAAAAAAVNVTALAVTTALLVVQASSTFVSVTTHKEKQCRNILYNSTKTML